jgi:hypothetical protein
MRNALGPEVVLGAPVHRRGSIALSHCGFRVLALERVTAQAAVTSSASRRVLKEARLTRGAPGSVLGEVEYALRRIDWDAGLEAEASTEERV